MLLFGVFIALGGREPARGLRRRCTRARSATWFSLQNTLQRAAPLMLTALCDGAAARLGLVVHRRRRRAGARRAGRGGVGPALCTPPAACRRPAMVARRVRWSAALWIGAGRRAARLPRRQRDHQQPAARLHRDRAVQPPRRGAAARPGQPQQAVDAAASATTTCSATLPGLDVHWGLGLRPRRLPRRLGADAADDRSASRRAWSAATCAPRCSPACRCGG